MYCKYFCAKTETFPGQSESVILNDFNNFEQT